MNNITYFPIDKILMSEVDGMTVLIYNMTEEDFEKYEETGYIPRDLKIEIRENKILWKI